SGRSERIRFSRRYANGRRPSASILVCDGTRAPSSITASAPAGSRAAMRKGGRSKRRARSGSFCSISATRAALDRHPCMGLLSNLFGAGNTAREIAQINRRRAELAGLSDDALRDAFQSTQDLHETVAIVAVVAARVLGLEMFDVQLRGALAL